MEKWQERLIPRRSGIKELEQGETSSQMKELWPKRWPCARELLPTRGWCLWKCSTLVGDIIAVVLDENVEGCLGDIQSTQ